MPQMKGGLLAFCLSFFGYPKGAKCLGHLLCFKLYD